MYVCFQSGKIRKLNIEVQELRIYCLTNMLFEQCFINNYENRNKTKMIKCN